MTTDLSLPILEAELRQQLDDLTLPAAPWVEPRTVDGQAVLDVLIVGAGMCGLSASAALRFLGIDRQRIVDRAPQGQEGPWVTYARMETLRSPKSLTGPALDIPALTFRAWHRARFGEAAWAAVDKIPRTMWMDYLRWYRHALDIPVENGVALLGLEPQAGGLVCARLSGPGGEERVLARHVVLANGRDGLGGKFIPANVQRLPQALWAHTSDDIDFAALRGKAVAVIGAGASAMDNAATALENGAARVDLFIRRADIPRINKLTGVSNPGLVHGYQELEEAWKLRVMHYSLDSGPPPPRASVLRVSRHPNAFFHLDSPLLTLEPADGQVRIVTPKGEYRADLLIAATGFSVDLAQRPELATIAPHIRRWIDRPGCEPGESRHAEALGELPDLGPGFEFQNKGPLPLPGLDHVHCLSLIHI